MNLFWSTISLGFDRVGHDGLARMVITIRNALDEYHCEIHSMVVEHNKAFCRLRFTGKHVGDLLGIPPTYQNVAWMGATEFTIQNHKILKVWELGDVKSLEEQLMSHGSGTTSATATASSTATMNATNHDEQHQVSSDDMVDDTTVAESLVVPSHSNGVVKPPEGNDHDEMTEVE